MSYCTAADILTFFGKTNVNRWADLENTKVQSEIDARIAVAITYAHNEVNDRLRGGPYTTPLVEPPPNIITDIAARLAGVWLYESRGVEDIEESGKAVHKLTWHKDYARRVLREIRNGIRRLDLLSTVTIPTVLDVDDE